MSDAPVEIKMYRELWEKKLFVSSGNLARFAYIPGGLGEEYAVSIYRKPGRGNPDTYWLTVTKSSISLWEWIIEKDKSKRINSRIKVTRCDIPIPESTATVVHEAWLAMLLRVRPDPNRYVVLDSTTEIFYVSHDGKLLRGELPLDAAGNALELYEIAVGLEICCEVSPADRPIHLRKVESMTAKLIARVNLQK